jgi:hypothetical protein
MFWVGLAFSALMVLLAVALVFMQMEMMGRLGH